MYTYPRWSGGFQPSTSRSWRWPLKISRFCRVFVHQADVIDTCTCTCKLMVGKTIFSDSFCGFMKTPRFMCKLSVRFSESILRRLVEYVSELEGDLPTCWTPTLLKALKFCDLKRSHSKQGTDSTEKLFRLQILATEKFQGIQGCENVFLIQMVDLYREYTHYMYSYIYILDSYYL